MVVVVFGCYSLQADSLSAKYVVKSPASRGFFIFNSFQPILQPILWLDCFSSLPNGQLPPGVYAVLPRLPSFCPSTETALHMIILQSGFAAMSLPIISRQSCPRISFEESFMLR